MKKLITILLVLFSLKCNAQRSGMDYLVMNKSDKVYIECIIESISDKYIVYHLRGSMETLTMNRNAVEQIYFSDNVKKCKLLPELCAIPNPKIDIKSSDVEPINSNGEILLLSDKPQDKIDSLDLSITYTNMCLTKFREAELAGIYTTLAGTIISSLSFAVPNSSTNNGKTQIDNTPRYLVSGAGAIAIIVGAIIYIDGFKWLNKCGKYPILEPYGNGVCIRF